MGKNFLLLSIVLCVSLPYNCFFDTKTSFLIKNCTNDTLLIEFAATDTLDNSIYWCNIEDSLWITESDTTWVYINDKKVIIKNFYYAQPDSIVCALDPTHWRQDTCYIYAIKWWVATHYTLDEIRKRKLYEKRAITKADFNERLYEYKR